MACPSQKFCASLPSSTSAYMLVTDPDAKSLGAVVGSTLARAALIAGGIYLASKILGWDEKNILRNSLAGAFGIEVFVLAYIAWRSRGGK